MIAASAKDDDVNQDMEPSTAYDSQSTTSVDTVNEPKKSGSKFKNKRKRKRNRKKKQQKD